MVESTNYNLLQQLPSFRLSMNSNFDGLEWN